MNCYCQLSVTCLLLIPRLTDITSHQTDRWTETDRQTDRRTKTDRRTETDGDGRTARWKTGKLYCLEKLCQWPKTVMHEIALCQLWYDMLVIKEWTNITEEWLKAHFPCSGLLALSYLIYFMTVEVSVKSLSRFSTSAYCLYPWSQLCRYLLRAVMH